MTPLLINDEDPAISVLTLNRPERRNALSLELIELLTDAVISSAKDPTRRVVILRGNGPAFCSGLDLREASVPGGAEKSAEALARMYAAIGNSPLVTIAAAHGAAMGGGAGILAACDFVVAADTLKLAYPEVKRGLVAALVTCLLRRRLNDGAVRELILLGQTVEAEEAFKLGLVSDVVVTEELLNTAMELARDICAGAPGAIMRTKQLLDDLAARPLEEDLKRALRVHLSARNSAEAAEGIAAFIEKREPKWGGRSSEE